jgi:hypothetical protein
MDPVGPKTDPAPPPVATPEPPRLIFGIFPGMTGTEGASTASAAMTYDPDRTEEALARLQAPGRPFLIRSYAVYKGNSQVETRTPPDLRRYLQHAGRALDHVLCYRSEDGDIDDWTRFVRQAVRELGDRPATLQITEEPNNPNPDTGGDGASPNVRQALVEGVLAAKDEARRRGLPIDVGFCATPSFNPSDDFWPDLAARGGPTFADAFDYVGLDFYPDVFRPIPAGQLQTAVEGVLTHFRTVNLAAGGIPAAVPIRVTENGWPTGPGRSPERQAEVLESTVRTIHRLRGTLNITHYEFFSLRDPGGEGTGFREFGLLREDYTPKPAFDVYRRLAAELDGQV